MVSVYCVNTTTVLCVFRASRMSLISRSAFESNVSRSRELMKS